MIAFAKEWLTKLFGSEVAAAIKKSSATRWNASPYVLGAMSAAAPGGQASRKILAEPIGAMFLAGEATHETLWGTVDGAWESGERAADAALRKIGAIRDEPVASVPAPRAARPRRHAAPRTATPYRELVLASAARRRARAGRRSRRARSGRSRCRGTRFRWRDRTARRRSARRSRRRDRPPARTG